MYETQHNKCWLLEKQIHCLMFLHKCVCEHEHQLVIVVLFNFHKPQTINKYST